MAFKKKKALDSNIVLHKKKKIIRKVQRGKSGRPRHSFKLQGLVSCQEKIADPMDLRRKTTIGGGITSRQG